MRHDKVEDTTLGKLGRKAGVGALKAMSKGKIAKKKWDLAHPEKTRRYSILTRSN